MSDIRKIQTGNNQYTLHARVSDKLAVSTQIGSPTKPVYVDSSGEVRACSRDIPTVDSAISNSSTNPIQNKAVFDALKLKADVAALDKCQPKYKADYIAKEDLSELPITKGILDLNGHSIYMHDNSYDGELTIQNGTILRIGKINAALNIINCTIENTDVEGVNEYNVTFNYSNIKRLFTNESIYCHIFNSNVGYLACDCDTINIYNSTVDELTCYTYGYNTVVIGNSYISTINYDPTSQPRHDGFIYLYNCVFETLDLDGYPRNIDVQLCSCCDYSNDVTYVNGYYDKTDGLRELAYTTEIQEGNDLPPTSDAVYNALGAYQPKYKADYIATKDFNYSELPNNVNTIDLNGYTLNIESDITVSGNLLNGSICIKTNDVWFDANKVINCTIYSNNSAFYIGIVDTVFYNCSILNAIFSGEPEFYNCTLNNWTFGNIGPIIYNSIIKNPKITGTIAYPLYNVIIDNVVYKKAIIKDGKFIEAGFESNINTPAISGNAPSCEAVLTALQSKADKTQLNNYVTTATANTTYAKKSDITNIYKFKGTKTNYADLPTTDRVTGDVWNITNADAEHGIKAGDNVAWNGTAWDNLSGTVDLSNYL